MLPSMYRAQRIVLDIVSIPFILIFRVVMSVVQVITKSDAMAELHHQAFRFAHGLVARFGKVIVEIAPTSFVDSVVHERDPADYPGKGHEWVEASPSTDSRSPCPALNTLANHGFLPHDGRNIHFHQLIDALMEGFNLTRPLAWFLTCGGFILLRQWGSISLEDLARHACIEHNASLAHYDCKKTQEYAPSEVATMFFERLLKDSSDGKGLTIEDIARARVRREKESQDGGGVPLDPIHAEIARGEMALVLDIFGTPLKEGGELEVPVDLLQQWWVPYERFPPGWAPHKKQGLLETIRTAAQIRTAMRVAEKKNENEAKMRREKEQNETWRKDGENLDEVLVQSLHPAVTSAG